MRTWRHEQVAGGVAAVLVAVWPGVASAGLTEEWYLMRARANVEIKNYRAAIEAYQKVLESNPGHREALKALGAAYEANGETDHAVAANDRYLSRYPDDAEVLFKQARFLGWSRYKYRRGDAIKYYKLALAKEDRPAERRALARLLAQDKATVGEAVAEYRRLVERSPDDATLRAEYRKVLLWDPRHRAEAIRELEKAERERPDAATSRQLAVLMAQQPGRRTEALTRYEALLEKAPKNRALRMEYARVLAMDSGRAADTTAQLELAMGPDASFEDRVMYADTLAAQPERRRDALERYQALVKEAPKDTALRLRYARLLGAEKDTSTEAIAHYEVVLRQEPKNADAHAGLARAYAWSGESDRALQHQRQAMRAGAGGDDLPALGATLEAGREPRLGGGVRVLLQPGGDYHLADFQLPVTGRMDVTEFLTVHAEAGFEAVFGPDSVMAAGLFMAGSGELRFSRTERMRTGVGLRTVRPGAEMLSAFGEYEHRGEQWALRARLERVPVMDSFFSLVGTGGEGAVSAHVLGLGVEHRQRSFRLWVTPKLALLMGAEVPATYQLGFDAGAELAVWEHEAWTAAVGYDASTSHFGADHSATTLGGYYSPALHLVQTPRVTLRHVVEDAHWVELTAGPSLQFQLLHARAGQWMPGVQGRFASTFKLTRAVELTGTAGVITMGDAYLRLDAGAAIQFLF